MQTSRDSWPHAQWLRLRSQRAPSRSPAVRVVGTSAAIRMLIVLAIACPIALCATGPALAADTQRSETEATTTETELFEALARHPAPTRRAALILAGDPEALLELDRIQQDSARQFAELLAPYARRERQQIWNLVRYPGLAAELARDGRKSRAELAAVADRYPPEEREAIVESGAERHALWLEIYGLELEARQRAHRALASADRSFQQAFEALEDRPELISLLLDDIRSTTRLGAAYREDPEGVAQRFATLAPEIEARRRQEQSAWAEELADPASEEELERAARAFAEAYGLEPEPASQRQHEYAAQVTLEDGGRRSRTLRNSARSHYAYPYWLGYPDWYAAPLWVPLGLADHVGFRIGRGRHARRRFIPVGLPSAVFLSWYHDVYRSGDRPISRRGVRYYDAHRPRPRPRRPRAPSAGIMREDEVRRSRQQGAGEAGRDRGRRTSTAGDSRGRGAGRGSRGESITLPPEGRVDPDRAP